VLRCEGVAHFSDDGIVGRELAICVGVDILVRFCNRSSTRL
jgi:hypothetical protein